MKRLATPLLLLAIAALAAWLREATADGHRLPSDQRSVEGIGADGEPLRVELPRWLIDDPDAAYHLRRTELALANGSVPLTDRFLSHPRGSPIPWPPLFDALLALGAELTLSADAGEPALDGYSEVELEDRLVHAPVALAVLATLAVFLAARLLCGDGGKGRDACALLAALVYACLPIATWYGGVARVDHHVLAAFFLAAQVGALTWTLRGRELADATLGALLAGLIAGLSVVSWLASAVFVGIGGGALLLRALSPDLERARGGARAGLLYFAAAAVVTMVPASQSPWNEVQPGSLLELTEGVTRALLAGAVPFAALLAALKRPRGVGFRLGLALASAVAVALLLPGFLANARDGFEWASRQNRFMDVVDESRPLFESSDGRWWSTALADFTPLGFLFPLALLALIPTVRRPERALLVAVGVACLASTWTQRRFGNSLAIPLALTLGVALHDLASRGAVARKAGVASGLGVAALALVFGTSPLRVPADELFELRAWRAELLGGLRWMRAGTPSPGAWNAPEARQDWGVLSDWSAGHLIEYHARRPTISTNFGSFVGAEGFRDGARALLATEPEELARALRELGARYVVVTPRHVGSLASTLRIAEVPPAERGRYFERTPQGKVYGGAARGSALWRLALTPTDVDTAHYPGLELVYRAHRRETADGRRPRAGEPSGPVISIYRLERSQDERGEGLFR